MVSSHGGARNPVAAPARPSVTRAASHAQSVMSWLQHTRVELKQGSPYCARTSGVAAAHTRRSEGRLPSRRGVRWNEGRTVQTSMPQIASSMRSEAAKETEACLVAQ
eukprot:scaffold108764_cov72-Phaeocystis_antarctica.AAC.1